MPMLFNFKIGLKTIVLNKMHNMHKVYQILCQELVDFTLHLTNGLKLIMSLCMTNKVKRIPTIRLLATLQIQMKSLFSRSPLILESFFIHLVTKRGRLKKSK